ncbi:hypothetical protein Agau_P100072 (plasmid) [Agrobacterium tumefaciens F2]|nr:hypothetical protein Agau_P100072 [Agrobacterium tumefaciens F2]
MRIKKSFYVSHCRAAENIKCVSDIANFREFRRNLAKSQTYFDMLIVDFRPIFLH